MNQLSYFLYLLAESGFRSSPRTMELLRAILTANPNPLTNLSAACLKLALPANKQSALLSLASENPLEQFSSSLTTYDIRTVHYFEDDYPALLRHIHDPPLVLYYRGNIRARGESIFILRSVAMVGSRRATWYGKSVISRVLHPLQDTNTCVVSGMAYGIDGASHEKALELHLPTIAVLGSGIDDESIYPTRHLSLAHRIILSGGLVLSEYPPGKRARDFQFVARNRIIAGLSEATIIVECEQKSGALITADFATELGRPVFAVPGSILSPTSNGTNNLLKQGAHPLTTTSDITDVLNIPLKAAGAVASPKLSEQEARVLKCMQTTPTTTDELQRATGIPANILLSTLTTLEISGQISNVGVQGFIKL